MRNYVLFFEMQHYRKCHIVAILLHQKEEEREVTCFFPGEKSRLFPFFSSPSPPLSHKSSAELPALFWHEARAEIRSKGNGSFFILSLLFLAGIAYGTIKLSWFFPATSCTIIY